MFFLALVSIEDQDCSNYLLQSAQGILNLYNRVECVPRLVNPHRLLVMTLSRHSLPCCFSGTIELHLVDEGVFLSALCTACACRSCLT